MGDFQRIIYRTGNGAGDHTAQGAGGKDHNAQYPSEEAGTALGLDESLFLQHDLGESIDTARNLNQMD